MWDTSLNVEIFESDLKKNIRNVADREAERITSEKELDEYMRENRHYKNVAW